MMKIINKYFKYFLSLVMIFLLSCEEPLDLTPKSEFAPENFLKTEKGITALLYAAYNEIQFNAFDGNNKFYFGELPTDLMWETGGGLNRSAILYIDYTWDSSHGWLQGVWRKLYRANRNANTFLENIDNADVPESRKKIMTAEAHFIRGFAYSFLYNLFGPVPLVTSSTSDELNPSKADAAEIETFIATEFNLAAQDLPETRPFSEYGQATKGAALGLLSKFYLNTRQWQKAADLSKQVIDLGIYELFLQYEDLFKVENEQNNEYIFVFPAIPEGGSGNVFPPASFPPNYPTPGTHENWAAQVRYYDDFVLSFDEKDVRKNLIITEYIDKDGNEVNLLGDDNSRSFKYWPDPNAVGRWTGNDIPELRYADILLTRAEALNEIDGPNQESIDLINEVRERADVDPLNLSDFISKEDLRAHILQERGWEFYTEAKRREDMIRHGVLISNAQARGKNAKPHHVLFPIPQSEIDANGNLEQNQGY